MAKEIKYKGTETHTLRTEYHYHNGVTTNHVWDGDYIIREMNGSGTEVSRYEYIYEI